MFITHLTNIKPMSVLLCKSQTLELTIDVLISTDRKSSSTDSTVKT